MSIKVNRKPPKIIGERLANFRRAHHYTQASFAEFLHTSQAMLSQIESGKVLIGTEYLFRLKDHFDEISFDIVLSREEGVEITLSGGMAPPRKEVADRVELAPQIYLEKMIQDKEKQIEELIKTIEDLRNDKDLLRSLLKGK